MANPTATAIINLARALLKTESTSSTPVIADTFLLPALNEGNMKWARAFRSNGAQPIVFQREFGIDLVADTTLSAAAATTDVTLSLTSSSSFPSASSIVIWDDGMPDVVSYTSNAANTLSGVTGIGFAHESGDQVQLLYALPSNFGAFRESPNYGDGVLVNGVVYRYMNAPPSAGYFSMYDDGTTKYLWLPLGLTGSCSVLYDKVSTTIDDLTDTVDVPTEYQFFLAWHLVAYGFMGRDGDANMMAFAQRQSDTILQSALEDRNGNKKLRVRQFGRHFRDYTTLNGAVIPLG